MSQIIDQIVVTITLLMQSLGPVSGIILVLLESIIPILPLGVFITLNIKAFDFIGGFFLSWIATIIGCMLSFFLFRFLFYNCFSVSLLRKRKLKRGIEAMKNISFPKLVMILSLPFTPAFIVNIAAGLSQMDKKKYLCALCIGKLSVVCFWGYIGKSLLNSIMDLKTVIVVILMLVVAYVSSKIIEKQMNLVE